MSHIDSLELVIAYSCDNKYIGIMTTSMISLFENNKIFRKIIVYCLLKGVDNEKINRIKKLGNSYKRDVICIDMEKICNISRFWEKTEDCRYVRLVLDQILYEEKVLYVDCDVMFKSDLRELWNTDLMGFSLGAVLDTCRSDARIESNIKVIDKYFNSGVMLINLEYWRKEGLYNKFKEFKLNNSRKGIYRDQRVLNGVCNDDFRILHPKYNLTSELITFSTEQIKKICNISSFYKDKELNDACDNPVIVHFAGRTIDRPWYSNCEHIYKLEYREYMKKNTYIKQEIMQDNCFNVFKWKMRKKIPVFCFAIWNKVKLLIYLLK